MALFAITSEEGCTHASLFTVMLVWQMGHVDCGKNHGGKGKEGGGGGGARISQPTGSPSRPESEGRGKGEEREREGGRWRPLLGLFPGEKISALVNRDRRR